MKEVINSEETIRASAPTFNINGDIVLNGGASVSGTLTANGSVAFGDAAVGDLTADSLLTDSVNGNDGATPSGAGLLSTGAGAPQIHTLEVNGEIITTIKMDLTGLSSKSDDGDVIGLAAGGAAYITTVTHNTTGVIHRVEMTCTELPTAAENVGLDFDLCAATPANLIYDNDATGAVGYSAIITGGGNMALGLTKEAVLGTVPVASAYLYLVTGATHTAESVYTAGQLVIKLYGYKLL